MTDGYITRNYFAHGGNELVIGGKLTILPGATVEGGSLSGGLTPAAAQADSEATTIAALKEDFNALLAALRTAGLLATNDAPATGGDD